MSMSVSIKFFNVAQIVNYFWVHESVYSENKNVIVKCGEGFVETVNLFILLDTHSDAS